MDITRPAFVVAELPDDLAAWVRATRLAFEPALSHLPAEITLAGSSGVGPISTGQRVESVRCRLEAAVADRLPFEARFDGIGNFAGTDIFFASPEPAPFIALHEAIVSSGVAFGPSPFPYRPHCSLKGLTALGPGQREALAGLPVPAAPFSIRTVSVYEMDRMQPHRLFSIQMPDHARIRLARPSERRALEALQLRASIGNPGDRDAVIANPDAIDVPLEQITAGHVFVLEAADAIKGFAAVLPREDGDAELDALFVDPGGWRHGCGRALVAYGAATARRRGAAALHVVGNPHAEGFYRACGFELVGTTSTRFGAGLLMRRVL